MKFHDILNPSSQRLRQFGLLSFIVFASIGAIIWRYGGLFGLEFGNAAQPVGLTLVALGLASGLLALVAPRANYPLHLVLTVLTYPIGLVMSYVIMTVLFFGLITPTGLMFRLLGRDPLSRRFDPKAKTYWKVHGLRSKKTTSYFSQF